MNKEEVKQHIDKIAECMELAGTNILNKDDVGKMFRYELAMFMMYLSASDGTVMHSETQTIAYYTGVDLTPEKMATFIRDNNIYSTEFENKVPASLQLAVLADNMIRSFDKETEIVASELVLTAYKLMANELVNADGEFSVNEQADVDIFIKNIEKYVDENSVARKENTTGFTKNTGDSNSVSAPPKNGVSAPKKG